MGIGVLIVSPLVKKLMHLDTLTDEVARSEAERVFGDAELDEPQAAEAEAAGIHPATKLND